MIFQICLHGIDWILRCEVKKCARNGANISALRVGVADAKLTLIMIAPDYQRTLKKDSIKNLLARLLWLNL